MQSKAGLVGHPKFTWLSIALNLFLLVFQLSIFDVCIAVNIPVIVIVGVES